MGIEKLFFLAAMAIGFLSGAAFLRVWSDRERSLGAVRPWLAPDWMVVLLSVIFVVLLVEAYAHMESLAMRYGRRPLPVEHPIVLTVALGLMTGVAGRWFLLTTSRETAPAGLLARGAPVVLLFAAGFAGQDMRRVVGALTSVDAFGVALQFEIGKETEQDGFTDPNSNSRLISYGTDFELGVKHAHTIVRGAENDFRNLRDFCSYQHKLFDCARWRTKAFSDGSIIIPIGDENWVKLIRSRDYLLAFSPFINCSFNEYVKYFPAGLPIQPLLHDIAADMIMPSANSERSTQIFSNLIGGFHHFTEYKKKFIDPVGTPDNSCMTFIIDPETYNYNSDQDSNPKFVGYHLEKVHPLEEQLKTHSMIFNLHGDYHIYSEKIQDIYPLNEFANNKWLADLGVIKREPRNDSETSSSDLAAKEDPPTDWREAMLVRAWEWRKSLSLQARQTHSQTEGGDPFGSLHVSVLEAAVITAAGYPSEAAAHLRREMKRHQRSRAGADTDGVSSATPSDFGDFLFKTKAMHALNEIYQRLGLRDEQYSLNTTYIAELETFLGRATPMSSRAPADVVRWCAKNQPMIDKLGSKGAPSRAIVNRQEHYLTQIIDVYIRQMLALIRAYAERPDRDRDTGVGATLLAAAEDINRLMTGERPVLERCIGQLYKDSGEAQNIDWHLQRLSLEALAVHGLLQMSLGHDLRSVEGMETSPEVRRLYCGAAASLRDAVRLSTMRVGDQPLISRNHELLARIRPLAAELQPTLERC